MMRQSSQERFVFASALMAFLLAAYPPIQAALFNPATVIPSFFAADAFYYLSIARNSAFGHYTFDGRTLTNGFHPLWQIVLQLLVTHLPQNTGLLPMLASFSLCILTTSLGLAFVAAALCSMSRAVWPVFLLFPGIYFLFALQVDPRYGSVWSFINGMESPFSILFFGLLLFLVVQGRCVRNRFGMLLLSAVSIGIFTSRLDDIFLPVVFAMWFFTSARRSLGTAASIRWTAIYAVPIGLVLSAYLAFNWITVGVLLPTSGAVKARGFGVLQNLAWLVYGLFPFASALLHRLIPKLPYPVPGVLIGWRMVQLLLPMLVAAFLLTWRKLLLSIAGSQSSLFRMLLSYVLLKGAYNLLFVPLFNQGHWYFPLSILIVDLVLALATVRVAEKAIALDKVRPWQVALPLFAFAWLSAVGQIWRVLDPTYQNTSNIQTLERAQIITSELKSRLGAYRIVEFDDGILNYALSTPTLSGLGLASDQETAKALRKGTLLSVAAASGYNVIATVNYPLVDPGRITSDQLRARFRTWFLASETDLDRFDYSLVYIDPVSRATFIKFTPR